MINPVLIFSEFLGGGIDWKNLIRTKGPEFANVEMRKLLKAHLVDIPKKKDGSAGKSRIAKIAENMNHDGFFWDSQEARFVNMADEGLGQGFKLSRDALYRIIENSFVPGGWLRDKWRDSDDNAIWAKIKDSCPHACSLDIIVEQTAEAWLDLTFGSKSNPNSSTGTPAAPTPTFIGESPAPTETAPVTPSN